MMMPTYNSFFNFIDKKIPYSLYKEYLYCVILYSHYLTRRNVVYSSELNAILTSWIKQYIFTYL